MDFNLGLVPRCNPRRQGQAQTGSECVRLADIAGAEESIEDVVPIDSSAIIALLKEMKNNFDFIIVDLPRHLLAAQKRLLVAAHEIVVVTELSLAGIRFYLLRG